MRARGLSFDLAVWRYAGDTSSFAVASTWRRSRLLRLGRAMATVNNEINVTCWTRSFPARLHSLGNSAYPLGRRGQGCACARPCTHGRWLFRCGNFGFGRQLKLVSLEVARMRTIASNRTLQNQFRRKALAPKMWKLAARKNKAFSSRAMKHINPATSSARWLLTKLLNKRRRRTDPLAQAVCHVCVDLTHLAYDVLSCHGLYRRMLAIVLSSWLSLLTVMSDWVCAVMGARSVWQSTTIGDEEKVMAKNSHLEIFQGGDFSEFAERLTFHFLASDIGKVPLSAKLEEKQAAIKKQVAVLVTHLSPSVYSVLKSLCLPESPIDKSFSELSDLLKNYYKPNVSTVSATYSFQQCRQQDLSVVDFVNKLKRLAEPCKFDAHYDRALRDQFISGIRCLETRKEILALPESKGKTFADVYKLALAKESAKKAADQISSSVVDDQSRYAAAPVHGVRQKFRRDRPSGRGSAEARSSSQQTSRKPCYRCDRHGHSPAECFYKQAKCHFCGEKGHVVQACRRKRRTTTNYVEAQSDQPGECQLPIFNVNVNNTSTTTHKPYLTNVNVNGANIQFEIDTGSAVTLMSESDFMHCNVPRSELSPPSVILMGYGNNEIQCLGEIELPISLGEKTCQTIVRVTTARNSLLGRDVMSKIRLPWEKIFSVGSPSTSTGTDFVQKYPDLFDCSKVGKVEGVQVKLQVSDENPVYQKARPVPLAIREKYVDALQQIGTGRYNRESEDVRMGLPNSTCYQTWWYLTDMCWLLSNH